jgi:hypothetical protein
LISKIETLLVGKEPAETHLDADQIDAMKRILKRAGVTNPSTAPVLAGAVAATMSQHVAMIRAPGYTMPERQIEDRLRVLWRLVEQPDPPVGPIRRLLRQLPERILREIEERAERLWPIYFGAPAPSAPTIGWFVDVPAERLLKILQPCISNGGMIVPGRRRDSGRRSRSRFEPMIRGIVRGSKPSSRLTPATANAGGRPRDDDALGLIAFLAMDWALATGERPMPGRSDEKPFGDLVHHVFGWLGLPEATGALRRYWREWERRTSRKSQVPID